MEHLHKISNPNLKKTFSQTGLRKHFYKEITTEIPADIGKGIIELNKRRRRSLHPPPQVQIVKPVKKKKVSEKSKPDSFPKRLKSRDKCMKKKSTIDRMIAIVNENPMEVYPKFKNRYQKNASSKHSSKYEL